jgi:hypothetical protein
VRTKTCQLSYCSPLHLWVLHQFAAAVYLQIKSLSIHGVCFCSMPWLSGIGRMLLATLQLEPLTLCLCSMISVRLLCDRRAQSCQSRRQYSQQPPHLALFRWRYRHGPPHVPYAHMAPLRPGFYRALVMPAASCSSTSFSLAQTDGRLSVCEERFAQDVCSVAVSHWHADCATDRAATGTCCTDCCECFCGSQGLMTAAPKMVPLTYFME